LLAVSRDQSIYRVIYCSMGSWVMSNSTGIIFNNEMDDFSIPSASDGLLTATANSIKPAKSPMSSMAPLILLNEKHEATMIAGGAGQFYDFLFLLLLSLPLCLITLFVHTQQVEFSS
jgi:gamma-glutamyltranspeptidase